MIKCLNCGNALTSKHAKKFCGRSCAAIYNNSIRPAASRKKQAETLRKRKQITYNLNCSQCKIEFQKPSTLTYCSRACMILARKEKEIIRFKEGKVHTSSAIRKHLTETRGYSCEECGLSEWNGKDLTLQVDHINGDPGNNFPDNLRLMCPNCHSQTPTYKGGNRFDLKMDDRSVMHRRIYRKRMRAG